MERPAAVPLFSLSEKTVRGFTYPRRNQVHTLDVNAHTRDRTPPRLAPPEDSYPASRWGPYHPPPVMYITAIVGHPTMLL